MKTFSIITFILFFIIFVSLPASAYWPTTVYENLAVSVYPDTGAIECIALPYPDGTTFVVFHKQWYGYVYQIIDKYGELKYPEPPRVVPGNPSFDMQVREVIPDGENGAFVVWDSHNQNPIQGIVAQRLDSFGNLMWGDSGVVISPFEETDFDICIDGEGGFLIAVAPDEEAIDQSDLYAQRIDGEGNLLWDPQGVLVSGNPGYSEKYPKITMDGNGGAFIIWEDVRPPYYPLGALFAQRIGGNGNTLWSNNLFICENVWFHQIIPDGEGGFILHTGAGTYNTAYRIDSNGNILWERDHVSWYEMAKLVPGESGFFYIGFPYNTGIYVQKMDIEGNTYWPTFGSLEGALMGDYPGHIYNARDCYFYENPYFYGLFSYRINGSYPRLFFFQKIDSLGNRILGDNGVVLTSINDGNYQYTNAVPDGEGGVVLVYQDYPTYDVWAKRCRADGTLGGPLHLLVDLTPHNPPVQIPPSGGSFNYDISIEDTYSVSGVFDMWIEVTLPGGSDIEVIYREDLTIDSNSTILRTDLQQFVPYRAPAGEYTYTAYVGNHEYNVVWSEDSFTFEKFSGVDEPAHGEGWSLYRFFDDSEIGSAFSESPADFARLSAHPNPFNVETAISYKLQAASFVELTVYDITGREVAMLESGYHPAGNHAASWNGGDYTSGIYFVRLKIGNHSTVRKVLLVK